MALRPTRRLQCQVAVHGCSLLCCPLPQISPAKPVETKAEKKRREKVEEARRAAADYKARQRMLGNIQFIGQLYIKKMLTERIMHECIVKLLGEVRGA